MCGIAGIISSNPALINTAALKKMADTLEHRGPDGEGFWINEKNNAGFGHRRLSVIDLSDSAAQPMHYMNRYTIVFNGEIYNYLELRLELNKAGYFFNTGSDTEVILAAYDLYKFRCLQYFDGMFAFAIWDEELQQLFAARDRFGEKPFYYFSQDDTFKFASEMKALWANGVEKNIDKKMLLNYLALGHVQNPSDKAQTFYKNIHSLKPAHYLLLQAPSNRFSIVHYWDINKQVSQNFTEAQALHKLEHLLTGSVHRRLRSDVRLGACLNGGLDNSTIVAFINSLFQKRNSDTRLKTFSAVFPGFQKDESSYIRLVTERFKILNYQVTPDAPGLINDFEKLCDHQEEPFPLPANRAQPKILALQTWRG